MVGEGNLKIEGRGCSFGVGGVGWGAEERKELTIKMALYAQMDLSVLSFSSSAGCTFDILLLIKPKLQRDTENSESSSPPPPPPHPSPPKPRCCFFSFLLEKKKAALMQMTQQSRHKTHRHTERKKKKKPQQARVKKGEFRISVLRLNYEY